MGGCQIRIIVFILVIPFVFLSLGCSDENDTQPTISVNENSNYEKTFNDLKLGILFDFKFYLPQTDERRWSF